MAPTLPLQRTPAVPPPVPWHARARRPAPRLAPGAWVVVNGLRVRPAAAEAAATERCVVSLPRRLMPRGARAATLPGASDAEVLEHPVRDAVGLALVLACFVLAALAV